MLFFRAKILGMKRLTCNRLLSCLKCADRITPGNANFDASRHLSYFQLHSASNHLKPKTISVCNAIYKRTLRKSASKIATREETLRNTDIDSFEEFLSSTSEPKPFRKPSQIRTENVKRLFTVSNISTEDNEQQTDAEMELQQKKAIDLATQIRREKAEKKSPYHNTVGSTTTFC